MLTAQTLLHTKIFGDYLNHSKPLAYRRQDWLALGKGRERSVRLIVRALLGVPSAHHGEQEHALWAFEFPNESLLVVYLARGTSIDLAVRNDEEPPLQEAVDFLINEVSTRLKQL